MAKFEMATLGRVLVCLVGAVVGWSAGVAVGFGVVLSFFWLSNGGRLSPEMGGGFELFYSGIAGLVASVPGLLLGVRAAAGLVLAESDRSGLCGGGSPADFTGTGGLARGVSPGQGRSSREHGEVEGGRDHKINSERPMRAGMISSARPVRVSQ